ncbi:hypothetical protein H5410_026777 [Solanum commersonii]|uniref:DUF7746 domain-containing protein n=1 Tax=Solanum commersonii TaxID=4109 RepID=A0A9J5YZH1_SOLCO|nr:hypothetical protein H5410_026777 [Solanum commersonii]
METTFAFKNQVDLEINKLRGYPKKNSGFIGQLRGWWDNYMSLEAKATVLNAKERVKKTLQNSQGAIPYGAYSYGKLIGACTQEGINLCNELKLSRQLKIDKLRERSQLGYFCTQFGLPDTTAKAPNCRLEKIKTLELEEDMHDKIYSFLYTYGSVFDYDNGDYSESGSETDKLETSGNTQSATIDACKCRGDIYSCENDEFYKLQSQFEDINIHTITFNIIIELLNEVTDNTLCEKIIQLAANNKANSSNVTQKSKNEFEYSSPYSLSEVNNRLSK